MRALGLDAQFIVTCGLLDMQAASIWSWIDQPNDDPTVTLLGASEQIRVPVFRCDTRYLLGLAAWVVAPIPGRAAPLFAVSTYSPDHNLAHCLRVVEVTPAFDALVHSWPMLIPILDWEHPALGDNDREFLVRAAASRP